MIHPEDVIAAKRDRRALSTEAITAFVAGVGDGRVVDAQIAAFAMAVVLNGMNARETADLTRAMADSGRRLRWDDLAGPVVDKHSTGGVGDKVSLILAALLAACGAFVPMVSGRGLGHTGGTLDKLEAIPGLSVEADGAVMRRILAEAGCAIVGAGPDLAPADRRIYAVRDVTATFGSEALIVASILSKKLAAGVGHLVMDVKVGSGALLPDEDAAQDLAQALVTTAAEAGLACQAVLTDMDQVLGRTAGNALETAEAIAALRDPAQTEPRLLAVTLALAGAALALAGLVDDAAAGERQAMSALHDGRAAERFARMVRAQGGPAGLVDRPERHLAAAPTIVPVPAPEGGVVAAIDVRALGEAVIDLGGGRRRPGDAIDPSVGLAAVAEIGQRISQGEPLAFVHASGDAEARRIVPHVRRAFRLGGEAVTGAGPVRRVVTG
ncbi:thymidine phosphorylase [Marinivivus vitaminiproducens]|uniref:thymidine phosphorylase n=1 Tax=Marinivivus vitaminiproducens TaxID=3035935 RepID=UPI0027A1FEE4|nr:thymidine phosphorylase [Geminicoccaceae bacterium SCSIO 64248]